MRVWIVTIGEPLPIDGESIRLYRSGLLVKKLSEIGHEVTWWTSSFNHVTKSARFKNTKSLALSDSYRLILLSAPGYKKNVSISRFVNHWILSFKFYYFAEKEIKPDVVLCSFPSVELANQVVKYSKRNNIPIIVDVRDLWPDIFVDFAPRKFKWLVAYLSKPLVKLTKNIFKNSDAIIGVSENYLKWGLAYAGRKRGIRDKVFPLGYERQKSAALVESQEKFRNNAVDKHYLNILFVGSFGKTYNLTTVINALKKYTEYSKYKIRLYICGDGERRREWEKLSQGMDNIVFTGWLNKDEIAHYLSISDVGLMAYEQGAPQGLPNKIFEYMSAGLPILNSLQGEASDLIHESNCGITYLSNNIDDFLSALSIFEDSVKRQSMADNALRVFEEKYDADKVYSNLISYLESFV